MYKNTYVHTFTDPLVLTVNSESVTFVKPGVEPTDEIQYHLSPVFHVTLGHTLTSNTSTLHIQYIRNM